MGEFPNFEQRAQVWVALSELFVGKELQEYDYAAIAKALNKSSFSMHELEHILQHEVAPVFRKNLSSFAIPEMEGWEQSTVVAEVRAQLMQKQGSFVRMLQRWIAKPLPDLANKRWIRVKSLLS